MEKKKFEVVSTQSYINWTGKKVTGTHSGKINIKSGEILMENEKLVGGKFVADTKSIKILDIVDPDANAQLAAHLASDDFFSSEKYPEAIFEITNSQTSSLNIHTMTGQLTIKGITHQESFDAELTISENSLLASGKIVVDRTKYDMKFRSGNFFKNLGDTLIYNDFDLDIQIIAELVPERVVA